MKSFDDHIGKSCAWPASPAVCLWKGHSTADATSGEGPFTDGQRFYQALQSSCGQQYYTDGESLFLPVCVVVPDAAPVVDLIDPLAAAPMCPQQALHEQADKEAFDPYDPLGIAGLEKQRSATKREDAWNTTWG
uniref:Uncharacterized protein n=1 Tax=Alexandrium andersonii TaxID=327968 RepID=A0A7S2DY11_9DINO|mmetsp:Transcript_60593/g.136386  ORF Transcript_60593/g.136386 Transcript_60593/m.136386 type:complete len:134 (+) Transcript_60593:1-402(+)